MPLQWGVVLVAIFGEDAPKKPPRPELDLSDVPNWDDDEETRKAKRKRMHERIYYGGGERDTTTARCRCAYPPRECTGS